MELDNLPPAEGRTDKADCYPHYNHDDDTSPSTASSPGDKLFGLSWANRNPGQDPSIILSVFIS